MEHQSQGGRIFLAFPIPEETPCPIFECGSTGGPVENAPFATTQSANVKKKQTRNRSTELDAIVACVGRGRRQLTRTVRSVRMELSGLLKIGRRFSSR